VEGLKIDTTEVKPQVTCWISSRTQTRGDKPFTFYWQAKITVVATKASNGLEGARSMKANLGHAAQAIERIIELSADAHITRRMVAQDSAAFHNLTGAIAAYGKALALLTALQQREEFYTMVAAAAWAVVRG
jgi:hypothetical protein